MSQSLAWFRKKMAEGLVIDPTEYEAIKQRKYAKRARKTASWRKSSTERRRIKFKQRK